MRPDSAAPSPPATTPSISEPGKDDENSSPVVDIQEGSVQITKRFLVLNNVGHLTMKMLQSMDEMDTNDENIDLAAGSEEGDLNYNIA